MPHMTPLVGIGAAAATLLGGMWVGDVVMSLAVGMFIYLDIKLVTDVVRPRLYYSIMCDSTGECKS